ncbi:HNH endonuclease [Candidatus Dojkabacteria bacterium]|jgi:hypothetical protein|nr:HNH endonuclease [Candidatus Dojkabacteria bacterium]
MKKGLFKKCSRCKGEFYIYPYLIQMDRIYCSIKCKRDNPPKNCVVCEKLITKKPDYAIEYWKNKKYCSVSCANKTRDTAKNLGEYAQKGKLAPRTAFKRNDPRITGKNNPNWKGGTTELSFQIRHSYVYNEWRRQIFQRDDYTCQRCGKRGVILQADHIKPFSVILKQNNIKTLLDAINCVELWDLNNGRTLCLDCHKKTDSYLKGRQPIWIS